MLTWASHSGCDEKIIQLLLDNGAQCTSKPFRSSLDLPVDGQVDAPLLMLPFCP